MGSDRGTGGSTVAYSTPGCRTRQLTSDPANELGKIPADAHIPAKVRTVFRARVTTIPRKILENIPLRPSLKRQAHELRSIPVAATARGRDRQGYLPDAEVSFP